MKPNPFKHSRSRYTARNKMDILKELDAAKSNEDVRKIVKAHNITTEEIEHWRMAYGERGLSGLCATKRIASRISL